METSVVDEEVGMDMSTTHTEQRKRIRPQRGA